MVEERVVIYVLYFFKPRIIKPLVTELLVYNRASGFSSNLYLLYKQ